MMHFDPAQLQAKIQSVLTLQNNRDYVPAAKRRVSKADPEKAKLKAEEKARKQKIADEARAARELAKKAKDILLARKIKEQQENECIRREAGFDPGKTTREKPIPTRDLKLEEKIMVKIDNKTWVYVDPGADIEAVKAKHRPQPLRLEEDKKPPVMRKSLKNPPVDDKEVKKLVEMKVPLKQIAKMLNVKPSSVKKAAKYMGLKV